MLYRLAAVLSAVGDDAIAVFKPARGGDLRYRLENVRYGGAVFGRDIVSRRDVRARDDENVHRRLRIYVAERINIFIRIYLLRGYLPRDYLTEQTVHDPISLLFVFKYAKTGRAACADAIPFFRFRFDGLFVFALSGGFGFLLPLYAGLFVMLSLAKLGKDAGTSALPFETTQSTVKCLAFSDFYFCHSFSLPSHSTSRTCVQKTN